MYSIFLTGTAGSGKSLLTSRIAPWYADRGSDVIIVNLDPGATSLPYDPDVDIRNYIDIDQLMEKYQLGPNGSLILAADLTATKLMEIEEEIASLNPDYAFFDTPGQIELFAYRNSGPYIAQSLRSEVKVNIFLFDASLVLSTSNFVSIALLSSSIRLRLNLPQISVLSKKDSVGELWKRIMSWSSRTKLENAMREELDGETYVLSSGMLSNLAGTGFYDELIPVSALTHEGIMELAATLSRITRSGEEVGG